MPEDQRPHVLVARVPDVKRYRRPPRGGGASNEVPPPSDPEAHALRLRTALRDATQQAAIQLSLREQLTDQRWNQAAAYLEFRSEPDVQMPLGSLENRASGIELVAVREEKDQENRRVLVATSAVPGAKLEYFEKKLDAYLESATESRRPKNQKLIDSLASVSVGAVDSLWTDPKELFPSAQGQHYWEVWLRGDEPAVLEAFTKVAKEAGSEISPRHLIFPERTVIMLKASVDELTQILILTDAIAELRRPSVAPHELLDLPRREQQQWADDVVQRADPPGPEAPALCVLDTGVTAVPLLMPGLSGADCLTVNPSWGSHDTYPNGHGTQVTGVGLFGDLSDVVATNAPIHLAYRAESVKILPPPPDRNHPQQYGPITEEAVSRIEAHQPRRRRAFALATTDRDAANDGRPSSWSAALDKLAYGGETGFPRLLCVSAGNNMEDCIPYPDAQETSPIQDPSQSWNALTIGAYTRKVAITNLTFAGWTPVAPNGGLSPMTTTSLAWPSREWAHKPDVVLEGGNYAQSAPTAVPGPVDDLMLLAVSPDPSAPFVGFDATSAAVALAGRLAARLMVAYPAYWPETIRALIVHSARWTPWMVQRYLGVSPASPSKQEVIALYRTCGMGVPDFERARWSTGSAVNLIVQAELQPYDDNDQPKDVNFHRLPWPVETLVALADDDATVRVTLSYFIEPEPTRRGSAGRHIYPSHQLRFRMKGPAESQRTFEKNVTATALEEGEQIEGSDDAAGWLLGPRDRWKGSIHSDVWTGTAAQLAGRDSIAVFPALGWWRRKPHLGRWQRKVRYALAVSLEVPEATIDIYSMVEAKNRIQIPVVI